MLIPPTPQDRACHYTINTLEGDPVGLGIFWRILSLYSTPDAVLGLAVGLQGPRRHIFPTIWGLITLLLPLLVGKYDPGYHTHVSNPRKAPRCKSGFTCHSHHLFGIFLDIDMVKQYRQHVKCFLEPGWTWESQETVMRCLKWESGVPNIIGSTVGNRLWGDWEIYHKDAEHGHAIYCNATDYGPL